MRKLKEIEHNNFEYADIIEELVAAPRSNEQLISLCESVVRYLRQSGQELHEYNEKIKIFREVLCKLP